MTSYPAGNPLNVYIAYLLNDASMASASVPDADYPNLSAEMVSDLGDPPWLPYAPAWRMWYYWYILNKLPIGHNVYCGVTPPNYSGDLTTAHLAVTAYNAKYGRSVAYISTDDAATVCNHIVTDAGDPLNTGS